MIGPVTVDDAHRPCILEMNRLQADRDRLAEQLREVERRAAQLEERVRIAEAEAIGARRRAARILRSRGR